VKEHYLLKDMQTIRICSGQKTDKIAIDGAMHKSSYTLATGANDDVQGGGGSDTIFGGKGHDNLLGGGGDDLIVGGPGGDHIDAGAGDNPDQIHPHKSDQNPTTVTSFRLIDASTDEAIGTLADGGVLNLASLPRKMNIQAIVSAGGNSGSVRFTYDGVDILPVENVAPFSLAGDDNGDFKNWTPRLGTHTLRAIPYAGKDLAGAEGTEKVITFTVVNDPGATPQGIPDDNSTDNNTVDQKNAPTAAITVMDASVAAGMAVHVNALHSTLKIGDPLSARYEWNFGDDGSKYNTLAGC